MGIKSIEETICYMFNAQFRNIVENCFAQTPKTKLATFIYVYS